MKLAGEDRERLKARVVALTGTTEGLERQKAEVVEAGKVAVAEVMKEVRGGEERSD